MKRLISFIILFSAFLLLCPSIKAQWEGAQVQRLTFNTLPNKMLEIYIDESEKLYLFYLEGVRDTNTGFVYDYRILYKTKEKGSTWSLPFEINTPTYIFGANRKGGLWMDTRTKIIHILHSTFPGDIYDDTLYYTNSTMPDWNFIKIDSLPGQQWHANYSSFKMEFDSTYNVHIIWHLNYDSLGQNWCKIIYANDSKNYWLKQQVTQPFPLGGFETNVSDLSVQNNGIVHIVYQGEPYCDTTCGIFYERNDSLNSTNWIISSVPKPSRPIWYYSINHIKIGYYNTIHLLAGGCIAQDCIWPGLIRIFYFYKSVNDTTWQGPELIPDTTTFSSLGDITQLVIDQTGIPYAGYAVNPGRVYITDRKTGAWIEPYEIVDTSHTYFADDFSFVLDVAGKGHGAFAGSRFDFMAQEDSQEIYYYGPPLSSVNNTTEDHNISSFELSQNYPNPFNSTTIIRYSLNSIPAVQTTLKLYNILGEEVKELVNTRQVKGNYRVSWDGKDNQGKEVASGIYFYQLQAGDYIETKRLLLIK